MRRDLKTLRTAFLVVLWLTAWTGCAERPADRSADRAAPAEITLRLIDEKDLAEALKRHRGEVVLVDFWATWCPPCVELFPHTVGLHRDLGGQGLAVITVSLDSPRDEAKVRNFLVEHEATTENFQSRFGGSNQSIERFHIPNGTIPVVRIYDRSGTLQKEFPTGDRGIEPEEIDRAVKELL